MKVLQLLPEFNAGGVERGTLEVAEFLVRNGHEAIVVSNGGQLVPALEKTGARHITMAVHRKSPASLFQVRPFRRLLERERPDILHIRSRLPAWIAWLAWRKLNAGTRPRLVSTVHGFYSVNPYSAIMTRGERVIAVSESIRSYLSANYGSLKQEVITVIPRGINLSEFPRGFQPAPSWMQAWREQYPQLAGKRILTLPGRITRLKGHEDFLQLIKRLVDENVGVHGLIVGGAHPKKRQYLDEIKGLVAQYYLTNHVSFTDHRNDLREIEAVSDIVFSLSIQPEAFGRTTLEALALGRPVIGYDHGGVGEQLRSMFPVGLIPLGDGATLLRVTKETLGHPVSPSTVPQSYTLETMCRRTLDVYEKLVRG